MTDELPNFAEASIEDVWKYRQEWQEQEAWACERRRHADKEIYRRLNEHNARIINTEHGKIEATYPREYAYNTRIVDGEFMKLIAEQELYAEFEAKAQRRYKIDRHWLNQLKKFGDKWIAVIDAMTGSSTGSPSLKGPSLEQMGGYAPREELVDVNAR